MLLDLPPEPPKLWLPPKPAIIRGAPDLIRPHKAILPGLLPVHVKLKLAKIVFVAAASSTSNLTTYDFGNFNAPTAGVMQVIVSSGGGTDQSIASISIGGTNAADVFTSTGSPNLRTSGGGSRYVSAGNQNVTVVLSGARGSTPFCAVGVFIITGSAAAVGMTNIAASTGGATSRATTLDEYVNGVLAYGGHHENTNATSWSAATNVYDATVGTVRVSFGMKATTVAATGATETMSWTGSVGARMAGVSWAAA